MFGFFKKKKKKKVERVEKRKKQRRVGDRPRRSEVRWEPDKEDRRSGEDRRKGGNTWDERDWQVIQTWAAVSLKSTGFYWKLNAFVVFLLVCVIKMTTHRNHNSIRKGQ